MLERVRASTPGRLQVVGVNFQDLAVRLASRSSGGCGVTFPALLDEPRATRSRGATACAASRRRSSSTRDGRRARPRLRRDEPPGARSPRSTTSSPARDVRPDLSRRPGPSRSLLPAEPAGRGERGEHRPRDEHDELAGRERLRREHRPHGVGERGRRAAPWRRPGARRAASTSGYAMPPRNSSTRNSALAAARFASARSVPAMSRPMPANATVPMSSRPSAGSIPPGTSQPSAMPVTTMSNAEMSSKSEHDRGLGREQSAARQRRRAEPLQHAVAPFEAGRDAERHHRGGHDRERQHAGHEEVDRIARSRSGSSCRPWRRTRGCRAGPRASRSGSRRAGAAA